jgi:hypothetical protein
LKLIDIETPAALIDERRMAGNIARLQDHLSALGVRLRVSGLPACNTPGMDLIELRPQGSA